MLEIGPVCGRTVHMAVSVPRENVSDNRPCSQITVDVLLQAYSCGVICFAHILETVSTFSALWMFFL